MSPTRIWPLSLCILFGAGCDSCQPAENTGATGVPSATGSTADSNKPPTPFPPPPARPAAPPTRRFVGVKSGATCPAQASPNAKGTFNVKPLGKHAALADFCVYEWASDKGPPGPEDVKLLPNDKLTAQKLIEDPAVNTGMSQYYDMVMDEGRRLLRQQTGVIATLPSTPKAPAAVDIAFPDSSPDKYGSITVGTLVHGFNIGNIGVGLATSAAAIPIMTLALPRFTEVADGPPEGGQLGTQADLAQAIERALDLWKASQESRLVLNLSVGWECTKDPKEFQPAYQALLHASCSGALIIAAAGNESADQAGKGPICPAQWETVPAPDASDCKRIEKGDFDMFAPKLKAAKAGAKPGANPPPGNAYAPLVHAVGAVDLMDLPIFNARPGSRSRLAALGYQAVEYPGQKPADKSTLLTGTSVSAAVVSAAAAQIWSLRPELSPAEVMQYIYDSGLPLTSQGKPVTAEFCLGANCSQVHRISICAATMAACKNNSCRADVGALTCAAPPPALASNKVVTDAAYAELMREVDAGAPASSSVAPPPNRFPVATPVESDFARWLVLPQPESLPCPQCTLQIQTWWLDGAIATDYYGSALPPYNSLKVKLYTSGGVFLSESDFSNSRGWNYGSTVHVQVTASSPAPGNATGTWANSHNQSVTQQLLLN